MNKKQKIIVSVVGITIVLLALLGLTYAYFLTRIQGNTNDKSISVTTANLELIYKDESPNIEVDALMPGTKIGTKSFSVTSKSNVDVLYGVFIEDLVYNFEYPTITYTLTCTNSDGTTCNGVSDDTSFPLTNDLLVSNNIRPEEVQTYELTLFYGDNGLDQSNDMNKEFSGKIQIYDLNNTVDIKGKVRGYNAGDYVKVSSSDPKISLINKYGEYKVVGVKAENHEITLFKKENDTYKEYQNNFVIEQSNNEEIADNIYNVTNDTRLLVMDINETDSKLSVENTDFINYDGEKYYSNISDAVVYATYSLNTVATQATVENDSFALANDSFKLLSNNLNDKIGWFTDSASTTLKIKYNGTNSNNLVSQSLTSIMAGNLNVDMEFDGEAIVKDKVYEGEVFWDNNFSFNLKVVNKGNLALKYKTEMKITSSDTNKLNRYLYVMVYDENDNLISEGSEINLASSLLSGEFDTYKVIVMLKV